MGNGFVEWFARSYKGIIVVLVAIFAAMMVVLAMQSVAASQVSADVTAAPIPTFSSTPTVPTVEVDRDGQAPLNVLFAGDSLTGGLSSSTQENGFKWRMLAEMQKTGPITEFNSALSGGTTLQVFNKYPVPANLDLAVIELGTNDSGNQIPQAQFRDAYSTLLDKVKAESPKVKIVCAGVWEGGGGTPGGSPYDISIRSLCTSAGGVFVPLQSIYTQPDVIGPAGAATWNGVTDDFHPNDRGHELIADALLKHITLK